MYRVLIKNDEQNVTNGTSTFCFYNTDRKIANALDRKDGDFVIIDDGNFYIKEVYETDSFEDFQKTIEELSKQYSLNRIIPVIPLGIDNTLKIKETDVLSTMNIILRVNGKIIYMDFSKIDAVYNLEQLQVDAPNKVELLSCRNDFTVKFNGINLNLDSPVDFYIESIDKESFIPVEFYNKEEIYGARINTLNSSIVDFIEIKSDNYLIPEGEIFMSFKNKRQIIKTNSEGKVLFYLCQKDDGLGFTDFKQHNIGKEKYYSYHNETGENKGIKDFIAGERIILNSKYEVIDTVRCVAEGIIPDKYPIDGRDFVMLGLNHYVYSTMILKLVNNIGNLNVMTGELIPLPSNRTPSVVDCSVHIVNNYMVDFSFHTTDINFLYSLSNSYTDNLANNYNNLGTFAPNYALISHFDLVDSDSVILMSLQNCNTILGVSVADGSYFTCGDGYYRTTKVSTTYKVPNSKKFIAPLFFQLDKNKIQDGEYAIKLISINPTSEFLGEKGSAFFDFSLSLDGSNTFISQPPSRMFQDSENYGNFIEISPYTLVGSLGKTQAADGNIAFYVYTFGEGQKYSLIVDNEIIPFRSYFYEKGR